MGWVSTERNHDEQPITVGVIDDDPMICQMMRLILEDYSSGRISVAFACTNAADAIEHASHNPPDVVLADIAMPGMDGIEVLKRTRAAGKRLPIIMLTAKSEVSDKVEGLDAGANDYLTKPFAAKELLARIRAMTRAATAIDATTLSVGNVRSIRRLARLWVPWARNT